MELNLHVERWGSGSRKLVLLHGFTGSAVSWRHLQPFFAPHFSVLAVDLPGHGLSPAPRHSGPRGFEETLDALERLFDREGVLRATVLGYSMGGRIALGFALRAPQRVEQLVIESGSPGLLHRRERDRRIADDELLARKLETDGLDRFVADWEQLALFEGVRRLPAETQDSLRLRRSQASAAGLAAALRSLGTGTQPSYWHDLIRLRTPTLLVTGANDAKFTEIARRMTRELPLGWRCTLPGVSHVPHLEAPAAYAREVLSFLRASFMDSEVSSEDADEEERSPL